MAVNTSKPRKAGSRSRRGELRMLFGRRRCLGAAVADVLRTEAKTGHQRDTQRSVSLHRRRTTTRNSPWQATHPRPVQTRLPDSSPSVAARRPGPANVAAKLRDGQGVGRPDPVREKTQQEYRRGNSPPRAKLRNRQKHGNRKPRRTPFARDRRDRCEQTASRVDPVIEPRPYMLSMRPAAASE